MGIWVLPNQNALQSVIGNTIPIACVLCWADKWMLLYRRCSLSNTTNGILDNCGWERFQIFNNWLTKMSRYTSTTLGLIYSHIRFRGRQQQPTDLLNAKWVRGKSEIKQEPTMCMSHKKASVCNDAQGNAYEIKSVSACIFAYQEDRTNRWMQPSKAWIRPIRTSASIAYRSGWGVGLHLVVIIWDGQCKLQHALLVSSDGAYTKPSI